jgi:hypothetical protein
MGQLPEGATTADIKAVCRDDISWDDIRLVVYGKP